VSAPDVLDWAVVRAAPDPSVALRAAFGAAGRGAHLVLACDIAPDDPAARAGIEAVLRLARPEARCPSTRGEVLAVVFGAHCTVRHERTESRPVLPAATERTSTVARAFLASFAADPPEWAPGGALPVLRMELTLISTAVDLAPAREGA
jgi:hypothetical protein